MSDLIIGIDVGTSGTKSILADAEGAVLASASSGYPTRRTADGGVWQDPEDWWSGIVATVREVLAGIDPSRVGALSVSAQGGTLVPVGEKVEPVGPARSWLDNGAEAAAARLGAEFSAHGFYRRTGWRLGPRYNAVQLARMAVEAEADFARTSCFLDTAGFVLSRMTGTMATDANSAGITQLMDVARQAYDEQILQSLSLEPSRLPTIFASGTSIGPLTSEVAEQLGLTTSTVVVAGGHDQYCAAVGAGATDERSLLLSAGTAWVVLGSSQRLIVDPQESFSFGRHVVPGYFGQFGSLLNGGSSLEWVRTFLGSPDAPLSFDTINAEAASAPAGASGLVFLPHFGGTVPTWNENSRGSFVGLDLAHSRREILRATLEGIAAEAATLISLHHQLNPDALRVKMIGGATRSAVWVQILADIVGLPIDLPACSDAAALGAAMIAAAGEPDRIAATSLQMSAASVVVDPGPDQDRYLRLNEVRKRFALDLSDTYTRVASDAAAEERTSRGDS